LKYFQNYSTHSYEISSTVYLNNEGRIQSCHIDLLNDMDFLLILFNLNMIFIFLNLDQSFYIPKL